MRPSLVHLGFAALLASGGAIGCGAEDMEGEGAQFPEPPTQPVGYDPPDSPPPPPSAAEAPVTPVVDAPAAPSTEPVPLVVGSTTEEELRAQGPQGGDVAVGADATDYEDTDPSALTDFRAALDPYGSWVQDPTYGTVWTPSPTVVGEDFAPYVSGGHWTYDDVDNWVWASDYDWGWAPFHYGRWAYTGSRWGWIPGRRYAGAWVNWRYTDDGYIGWAPMAPSWYWRDGYALGLGFAPPLPYAFCPVGAVFAPSLPGRIVSGGQAAAIGSRSRVYAAPTVRGSGGPSGSGRVAASPTVGAGGGRVAANPTVGGPAPSVLRIPPSQVTRPSSSDRGLLHAQQFAHPLTAGPLGAHSPALSPVRNVASTGPTRLGSMPAYGHFAPVATAPRYQGIAPTPYHPSYAGRSPYGSRSVGTLPSYGGYGYGAPNAYGGGGVRASPYGGGAFGGYRPAAGAPVQSGNGQKRPVYEPPVVHRGGGGGFRGGGFHGGGGFRGGGGHR